MGSFEKPYWSKLQVELWVCTRSREAVGLAEYAPGRTHFADLSIGPDGLDEAYDQDTPTFDDEIDLIGTAIVNYGCVCPFEDARKEVIVALSKGQLQQHQDRSSGIEFFEREEVLRRWHDPRCETLRAKTEALMLAEAVTRRAYGQELPSALLRERWRRHGGVFPAYVRKKLDMAGERILEMIRRGEIQAEGFPCVRDEGTGRMNRSGDMARLEDDHAFLAHRLWVDPCADAIWTEPTLADGSFNPIERGYRDISLNRTQFLAAAAVEQRVRTSGRLMWGAARACRPLGDQV